MKIKPNPVRIIITYIIIFVVMELSLWILMGTRFWTLTSIQEYFASSFLTDLIYTIIILLVCIIFMILTLVNSYYEFDKKHLIYKSMKTYEYTYDNIVYINVDYSSKHSTLEFFLNSGKNVLLTMDKDKKLLTELQSRCHKLLSKEEFLKKYPNARL